jgi:hypothetical protein
LSNLTWGLLGPEALAGERRTRTLGLAAVVRLFNDHAVPGLGGVWFGKQVLLATLGIAVAEKLRHAGRRVRNIEVANAVEALACWLALNGNDWNRDSRLRGATKMAGKSDLSYAAVRSPGFYVTGPMRQSTIQPLRALGLVEGTGERFNAFNCTRLGSDFIEAACEDFRPYKREVVEHLVLWAASAHDDVTNSGPLRQALSPLEPLTPRAREFLRERIVQGAGEAARRRQALAWVERLRVEAGSAGSWKQKPDELDDAHWRDLRAGALFFATRDAALAVLDHIEAHIANQSDQCMRLDDPLPKVVAGAIDSLRQRANTFIGNNHDPTPGTAATLFCRECAEPHSSRLLERLVARDGRVLRQCDRHIVPGIAFRGLQVDQPDSAHTPEEAGAEGDVTGTIPLPENISVRMRNLFLLNLDLRDELGGWLVGPEEEANES